MNALAEIYEHTAQELREPRLVQTRRGVVHTQVERTIMGRATAVATMACGNVLACEILRYLRFDEPIDPLTRCKNCERQTA
jgi:hypothetical protein